MVAQLTHHGNHIIYVIYKIYFMAEHTHTHTLSLSLSIASQRPLFPHIANDLSLDIDTLPIITDLSLSPYYLQVQNKLVVNYSG